MNWFARIDSKGYIRNIIKSTMLVCLFTNLAGCSNSPVKNIPNLANKDFGQFTQALANNGIEVSDTFISDPNGPLHRTDYVYDKKVMNRFDETQNLRHWGSSFNLLLKGTTNDNGINWGDVNIINLNFLVPAYMDYCSAKGGKFEKTSLQTYSFTCRKSSDDTILFFVAFIENLTLTKRDNPTREMNLNIDGFEWKTPSQSYDIVSSEYMLYMGASYVVKADALKSTERINSANQKNSEEANRINQQLLEKQKIEQAEKDRLAAADQVAHRQHQEHRQVGDQVCAEVKGSVQQNTGDFVYGQPQYQTIGGNNHIVGFVEGVSGKKIQIRISGINFTGNNGLKQSLDSLSKFNGGSTLKVGNIIWDSIYSWDGC